MLAQSSVNSPDNFGQQIDEGDWIRIPGGAAFDQKLVQSKNYSSIQAAKSKLAEQDKLVFVHDRYARNNKNKLRPGRVHIVTPDKTWRPEFAQLPYGGTEHQQHRYDLYVHKDYNRVKDDSIRPLEIHSDRDGFSRINNGRSQKHPFPTEWFPIEDAQHLRSIK